jgi:hypothetical protein
LKKLACFRPFSVFSGVHCRGYSQPLQRAIIDFSADHPFAAVNDKMKEHYGIEVPKESVRLMTEFHGKQMMLKESWQSNRPAAQETIIAETDGCMVPLVEYKEIPAEKTTDWDRRKHKDYAYRELKLSLAHAKGSVTPVFGGTMGTPVDSGKQLLRCVERVGLDQKSYVHCVGDGAPWIVNQVEEQFGKQGHYLIDLYHVCDYLVAAEKHCQTTSAKDWLEEQKVLLKKNQPLQVLGNLKPYLEASNVVEADAPVRVCYRYLENRLVYLDYQAAIANDLPIGSGEIESAHRYVPQKRLKLPGAWWKKEHADEILALRICRANRDWDNYWRMAA